MTPDEWVALKREEIREHLRAVADLSMRIANVRTDEQRIAAAEKAYRLLLSSRLEDKLTEGDPALEYQIRIRAFEFDGRGSYDSDPAARSPK